MEKILLFLAHQLDALVQGTGFLSPSMAELDDVFSLVASASYFRVG